MLFKNYLTYNFSFQITLACNYMQHVRCNRKKMHTIEILFIKKTLYVLRKYGSIIKKRREKKSIATKSIKMNKIKKKTVKQEKVQSSNTDFYFSPT